MNTILPLAEYSVCDKEYSQIISEELKKEGFERSATSVRDVYRDIRNGMRYYDGLELKNSHSDKKDEDSLANLIHEAYDEYFRTKKNGALWNSVKNKYNIGKLAGIPKPGDNKVSITTQECKMMASFVRFRAKLNVSPEFARYALENLAFALGVDMPKCEDVCQEEKTLDDFDFDDMLEHLENNGFIFESIKKKEVKVTIETYKRKTK